MLETITVPPSSGQPPKGLIVLLHGWGANYEDLVTLAPFLNLPEYQYVFPNAPLPHPYTPVGRMWYSFPEDFSLLESPTFGQNPELTSSRQSLLELFQSLAASTGIPPERTILGGFSQGGAMTLDIGLQLPLAGLMVLSGYLHGGVQPPRAGTSAPVLVVHGRQDTVVPIQAAWKTRDWLTQLGVSVQYDEFTMGHEIQPIVLEQARQFINAVLP